MQLKIVDVISPHIGKKKFPNIPKKCYEGVPKRMILLKMWTEVEIKSGKQWMLW